MGFRYHKRIKLGGGAGVNLSKSGIGASYRTRYGTVGDKGFSVRTGIPGLTYRGGTRDVAFLFGLLGGAFKLLAKAVGAGR